MSTRGRNTTHLLGAVQFLLILAGLSLFASTLFVQTSLAQAPTEPSAPPLERPAPLAPPEPPPPEQHPQNPHQPAANDSALGTIHISTDLVMVDATVKTKKGEVVSGLKPTDFVVREDGVSQKIQVFGQDTLPLNVVILLDTSTSTGHFLEPLRVASTRSLANLKPEDQVALMSFAGEALLRVPFTTNKAKIGAELITFETGGTTNINDALFSAAQYLRNEAPSGRRVIILISDDLPMDSGKFSTEEIIKESLLADAPVYNLKLPDLNPPADHAYSRTLSGLVYLPDVLRETGGEQFEVPKIENIPTVFADLINRIKTRYTLGYYVSADRPSGKTHKLAVSFAPSAGPGTRNYVILAKNGYISP